MPIVTPVLSKIFKKYVKDQLILRKVVREAEDNWGQPTYSTTDYNIKGVAYPIDVEDLTFLPPGIVKEGDINVVFLPFYRIGASLITPETMDRIIYAGKEFELRILTDIMDGSIAIIRTGYGKRLQ